jgi:hypothetical protein
MAIQWEEWKSLGGSFTGKAGVTSWGRERIDVFARDAEDSSIKWKFYDTDEVWHEGDPPGGVAKSDPAAASMEEGRIDVFVKGENGSCFHRFYELGSGWSEWGSRGGQITSDPAVTVWGARKLSLFVRGNNNLHYHKYFDNDDWSDWQQRGGDTPLDSAPTAISTEVNKFDVFARGPGNALYHLSWSYGGDWTFWENLGGQLTSAPAAVSPLSGTIVVFANIINDDGQEKLAYTTNQNNYSNWISFDDKLKSDPAVVSWEHGRIDIIAQRSGSQALYWKYTTNFSL